MERLKAVIKASPSQVKAMLILMGIGLLLRAWGLNFGLPNESRPDELPICQSVVEHILHPLMTQGDLRFNPGFFIYPSLFLYLTTLAYLVFYGLGNLLGWFHGWNAFLSIYTMDATPLYLTQRWVSVLAGTLTIPVLYFLGKQAIPSPLRTSLGKQVGWLSALLCTTSYLMIRNNHFGTVDSVFILGVCASLLMILRFQESRQTGDLDKACILIGLTISTKYPGALLCLPLLLAIGLQSPPMNLINGKAFLSNSAKALAYIFAVFALTSPWLVLNAQSLSTFFQVWGTFHYAPGDGYGQPNTLPGWIFYPTFAMFHGYGGFLCLFSLLGFFLMGKRHSHAGHWLLMSYAAGACLVLGPNVHVMTRYALILAPIVIVYGAVGVSAFHQIISQAIKTSPQRSWISNPCLIVLLGFCLYQPLSNALAFDVLLAQPDTRTLARTWILQHVPPRQAVATGPSSGRIILPRTYGQLLLNPSVPHDAPPPKVDVQPLDAQDLVINTYGSIETLRTLGIQYVILYFGLPISTNGAWELEALHQNAVLTEHFVPFQASPLPTQNAEFDPIDAFFLPFAHFEGFKQPGPEIFIFWLPPVVGPHK